MDFKAKLDRVADILVGLWKFRVQGKTPVWCCTYTIDGCYYDTNGAKTPEQALDRVYRVRRRLNK